MKKYILTLLFGTAATSAFTAKDASQLKVR